MKNRITYPLPVVIMLLHISGCSTPAERAKIEAKNRQKLMMSIQLIGSTDRKLSKEEAYEACDQKSEADGRLAERMEEMRQSVEYKNRGGGFAQGAARGLATWSARIDGKTTSLKSCMIDYGYIMREK